MGPEARFSESWASPRVRLGCCTQDGRIRLWVEEKGGVLGMRTQCAATERSGQERPNCAPVLGVIHVGVEWTHLGTPWMWGCSGETWMSPSVRVMIGYVAVPRTQVGCGTQQKQGGGQRCGAELTWLSLRNL